MHLDVLLVQGRLKTRDWKTREWKTRHQTAGVENAGVAQYGKPKSPLFNIVTSVLQQPLEQCEPDGLHALEYFYV